MMTRMLPFRLSLNQGLAVGAALLGAVAVLGSPYRGGVVTVDTRQLAAIEGLAAGERPDSYSARHPHQDALGRENANADLNASRVKRNRGRRLLPATAGEEQATEKDGFTESTRGGHGSSRKPGKEIKEGNQTKLGWPEGSP